MSTVLEAKDLCKTYIVNKKQNNVLKNVNLKIEEGEMVAIMGPSGSGKSTLLYSISGMDRPTAGEVFFEGKQMDKLSDNELSDLRLTKMGFIFQQMYMMRNLSILDNVILPGIKAKRSGVSKKDIEERGRSLLRKFDVAQIADNDTSEASGGQLQRACIARSMINNPKIIFADEPTGALNRSASDEVMEELAKLNREDTTIMLVTHDVKVAAKCSRLLFIVDGNIKAEYNLGRYEANSNLRDRERSLSNWLMEQGW
ncbi:MAG: ABC transporter ATP-binding protein [Lachnospiraceae bacterium]|nr:ABC transporter ATP-binding protein [Lachnospiraceae bacterium]